MDLLLNDFSFKIQMFFIFMVIVLLCIAGILALFYILFLLWKYRNREKHSLEFVLLQVAVPRDNEIKIDAAEQLFASLHSIHHGGFFSFF
ncbi:MAG: hypothetical protein N3A54_02275 [Patescibacteria group bacterium]|nr:hypothetical protein [Patescibacteria group bacterium]